MKTRKLLINKAFSVEQLQREIRAVYGEAVKGISFFDVLNETDEDTTVEIQIEDDADELQLDSILDAHIPEKTREEEAAEVEEQIAEERMKLVEKAPRFKQLLQRLKDLEDRVSALEV